MTLQCIAVIWKGVIKGQMFTTLKNFGLRVKQLNLNTTETHSLFQ